MSKLLGKVVATEQRPTTIDDFYFWTSEDLILNPFDVVKVSHIRDSSTFGVVEEISHITDSSSYLSNYISNDFGDVEAHANTERIGMNYVKAKVVGNTKNIYIPVKNNANVFFASKDEISEALGLKNIKNPLVCGYLEMYESADVEEKVVLPVMINSKFLIGPEGAHLNISGISGLAAKTSYAMFLLKSIQYNCLNNQDFDDDVAFVLLNVKGKDLLAIDEDNDLFDSEEDKAGTIEKYEMLGLDSKPFSNVKYYYPYSNNNVSNSYAPKDLLQRQQKLNKSFSFKYEYEKDKDNLDLMFSNIDDPTQTMDSILNYIISNQGKFGQITDWIKFIDEVEENGKAGNAARKDKDITISSWRKFNRIIKKSIYKNPLFADCSSDPNKKEVRLKDSIKKIKKNDVMVIDIAKLNESMQAFVFGDVMRSVSDLQLGQFEDVDQETIPSKIIIFIDELNKYASSDIPKSSPILRQILDIAERGRSLGIILFSAEQFKSSIHDRIKGNCSTHAYGRTNAIEMSKADYKYIPPVYKNIMTRLKQGEYIIQNPIFRSLINVKFPKPIYKQFK